METWQILAGTAVMVVFWAGLVTVLGFSPGPGSLALATLFGMVGFYLSAKVTERVVGGENA